MVETTPVYLSKTLKYPITVTKAVVNEAQRVSKHTPLFYYSYNDLEPAPLNEQEDIIEDSERPMREVKYVGSFESPLEGSVANILIKKGDVIQNAQSPVLTIMEECAHPIQYGGLCAICGGSMENLDEDNARAPIAMDHGTTNLKVSNKEAENIEKSSTLRLLNEKKLSLVVDLDQTVIHVTVDPTVLDWMQDPTNPNYNSVKDVKPFLLEEQPFIPHGYHGPPIPPNKRWYFCKMRPGLSKFLEKMSKMYEMHIYTMATRQYAIEIAKIIDPDGIYFGDRILSRDESGSLTQKSLKRLFPVDTSMVVIIDDRGDVWDWSPNLIKVIPYDFFLGIGDINSSFLPKKQALIGPSKRRTSVSILEEKIMEDLDTTTSNISNQSTNNEAVVSEANTSIVDRMIALTDTVIEDQEKERSSTLEQQEHDRPLAKLQENLDKIIEQEEDEENTTNNANDPDSRPPKERKKSVVEPHNLLSDDDNELETLGQALYRIHNEFYYEIEENAVTPDVKNIMTATKSLVFKDCVFLLSGILPQNTNLETTDIVIWAKSFGATFVTDYQKSVTHVICKNSGTLKVRLAKSVNPNVNIVNPDWLFACISLWDRVPVDGYTIKVDNLLSKAQVEDWKEFHSEEVHAADFNWKELDEEVNDFLGSSSDDENEDNDDEDNDANEIDFDKNDNSKRIKRKLSHDDNLELEDSKKAKLSKESNRPQSLNAVENDSDDTDDFEAELLADLESLDEQN